ncbi:VCBS domain-containing protein [Vibrio sp. 10N.222.54.C2]|uniref:VCBS domain-containing protein n=1 Tax=Vibrio sp. 10N.222.54.C2 TaxID=3229639 RepID=UPI00354D9446
MANKKNVEANKKNTEIKNKKSNKLEQKKPTQKKKRRLHSHLKVNIPLFQSLMMILPSLAKHAAAESIDNSSDAADQVTANNVTEKDVTDDHSKADSSAVALQEAQTSDSDVNSTLSASHAAHGSSSHLVPSHHLSTLSHPQVHYIPSVSMPTISSGSNGQPTHSNAPTTPALPVTFMPEVIKGTYGELHVDANGQYTFVLNPNSPQYILLNQHQPGTDHFALHLSNGSSIIVQIPVTGKQDTPNISGDLTGVVTEDHNIDSQGLLHANGKIDVIDPDQNESSVTPEVISGKYGSLTIDADGHWQYQVDNSLSNVQALTAATSLHESFTIHTKDGTPQTIDMTIGGNDDNAVITGVDAGTLTEDLTTQVQGQLSVTDSDLGEDHFQASQVTSNFGTLSITKDGAWTYSLDNNNPVVQRLGQGSTATDIVTVHSADGTAHQVMVTINGTNDTAVISGTNSGAVTEESQLKTSGTLTITDTDKGEDHFSNTDIAGQLGTLHLKDNGNWTYDLDNKNTAVQALAQGKTATDTITVHSADGTPHQITVTVNGTNDKAVIAGTNSGAVTEESQLQTSGTLTITDTDTGEAHFSNTDIAGQLGTLHLKDNGDWTYDLDNTNPTVQALAQGSKTTDIITVHSADGTPHQVTITVNGTNNAAIIGGVDTASISENTAGVNMSPDYAQPGIATLGNTTLYADGKLTITDPDTGESIFEKQGSNGYDYHGTYGDLILQNDGTWHYHADAGHLSGIGARPTTRGTAIDQLGEGQSLTDTITVHSKDGTTHDIVITIHGSNDRPYCSSEVVLANGSEDTRQTLTTAQLLANTVDVDANDAGKLTIENLHADHGSILNNADGTFTFTPEKDYNGDVHFRYDVKDAHGGVTHTGATTNLAAVNDNPDVTPLTDSVSEGADNHHTLNLLVGATDKDGDALTISHLEYAIDGQPQSGQLPTGITLDADGHTLIVDATDPAFNHLANGQSQQIAITYQVEDGHGGSTQQTATLTIAGTDDKATLVSNVIQLTETQALDSEFKSYRGQLQLIDPDSGDNTQFVFSGKYLGQGFAPGYLDVWPNGTYQFRLNTGTNHHSDDLISSLHAGESMELPYEVETTDGQKLTIMVKVTGEDNQAKIAVTPHSSLNNHVYEDHTSFGNTTNQLSSGGTLHVIDPDHDQAGFIAQTITTTEGGQFNINAQGQWSYDIDNDKVQHLGAGESFQQTFTVESIDGSAKKDITVTVHGTNDAPVASAEVRLANGLEDTQIVLTPAQLLANSSDVDDNDIGKLSIANLVADHGTVIDNKDGTFTFSPEKDYNGAVQFNYDIKDAHGGITHTQAGLTLTASQDAATFTGDSTGDVHEGHSFTAADGTVTNSSVGDRSPDHQHGNIGKLWNDQIHTDGHLNINDADSGEAHAQTGVYHGSYGQVILQTNGDWSYYASIGQDATGRAIDKLGEGQTLTDTITIQSKDGTPHDIVITIHGDNDRPYCSSEVVLANGSEDTRQTLTTAQLLANTVDVDANDAGKLTIENLHVDHGSILNNADGTFTFTPEKDYNGDVHFSYDVKDAHGGVTHTGATTNLAAVNDNPDVTPLTDSVSEGADNHHTLNLLVGATDKDGDALTISHLEYAIDGQLQAGKIPAGITLDTDGHTLIVDATDPAFNHLANGQSQQIAITYQVEDGHGGSTQQTATLTIAGTDDKATLVSNVIQLTETQALDSEFKSYRGQLQLIDPDSGDNTQFVFSGKYLGQGFAPGHLDVWPNGTYQFKLDAGTNHHPDDLISSLHAGESMELPYEVETTDGQKLTIMVKVTGEDNQAKIAVTPYSSLNNHVYEDHTSFGNTTSQLSSGGTLQVIDPDHDQAGFIAQTITTAEGGRFNINAQGQWSYDIDNDKVQHLGAGESFQQTFTVESIDGSAKKDITVTVHGTNDAPVASAEVRLANGLEDTQIVLTPAQLLANSSDVDDNDIGKLSIENLQADHGAIALNADGTFTFTPEKDYNGDVHFSYDVKDAHGGVTHTGASTTLSAAGDAAIFTGDKSGQITEDRHVQGDAQHTIFVTGVLNVIDPDASEDHFYATRNAHAVSDPYGGHLTIGKAGDWAYSVPNANIQHLAAGQVEQVQYEVTTAGGDKQIITINVHGTNDKPTVSEAIAGAHNIDEDAANATSGQIIISDVDHSDQHSVSIDSQHQPQYGSVTYNSNTQTWVYTLNNSNSHVNALNNGEQLTDKFSLLVDDGHGGITTQEVEMRIDGHSDVPPMPTLVAPAKITGSAGNQDLHASIGIPPIIHQGTPTPMTGWGISDHHGHSLTALHGQFGTLHVNPATGELSYDYQQTSSGVVKTHTGGSYGSGTDETDSFVLTLGGDQNSQVAVHLHLHSQSVHGNSGHHIDQTTLTGMDLSPIAPSPPPAPGMSQADEPDASFSTPDEVTLNFDEVTANLEHTAIGEHEQRSGAHAYLDALGINADSPSIDSPSHNVPVAHDIDIIFSDAESAYGAEQTDDGMSDGLSHHTDNPSIDDSLHHHNDVDGLPDIDPNN